MTEKDYARQTDLFAAVFSQQAASPTSSSGEEGAAGWGAYVLQSRLEVVEWDRCGPGGERWAWLGRQGTAEPANPRILNSRILPRPGHAARRCRRFSSQNATLNAMLRLAVDNFRRRSYL